MIYGQLFALITFISSTLSDYDLKPSRVLFDTDLPLPLYTHDLGQFSYRLNNSVYSRHNRRLSTLGSEITPLYPGYGSHFIYIYVGTPPQRQSVIVDTGSHYTAFPCVGCSQCGKHTDEYFDYKKSSTAKLSDCRGKPCDISQSYSEGSSWKAIMIEDKIWVGGLTAEVVHDGFLYATEFSFGCQSFETGLFRTQLADGIMGFSMTDDTLPFVLASRGLTENKVFSLCYRVGGGILTLGGVDQRIHGKHGISYVKLTKDAGWFTVNLLDIQLQEQKGTESKSIDINSKVWNNGKGVIVDSGTTDSYLPSSISSKFSQIFKEITGVAYTQSNVALSASQLEKMPNILFIFEGTDGTPLTIPMPWTSYVDSVGGGKFAFRVYLTEGSGAVLGANFMNGYNIIFDADKKRIGFAKSHCKYYEYAPISPTACTTAFGPVTDCNATCSKGSGIVLKYGMQTWGDICDEDSSKYPESGPKKCSIVCHDGALTRGNSACPESPWSKCSKSCSQKRNWPSISPGSACQYLEQTRNCYTGLCPYDHDDYVVYIHLKIGIEPKKWNWVYTEDLFTAFVILFKIHENSIELMNDPRFELENSSKLHIQIRLKRKDFDSIEDLNRTAQNIPRTMWKDSFPKDFIMSLSNASMLLDDVDHSRYGWVKTVQVLHAIAVPIFGDPQIDH